MQPQDTSQIVTPQKSAAQMDRQSVLCLLLIMLTAAGLYYAYAQSREKTMLNERAELITAQVMQFPAAVRAGVVRLRAMGVPLHRIDFSPDARSNRAVFSPQGGAVRYQRPPERLLEADVQWNFKGVSEGNEGWFIAGLGHDTAEGKDVFAYLAGLPLRLCERINLAHGLPAVPKTESMPIDLVTPAGGEVMAGLNPWTFAAHGKPVDTASGDSGVAPSAACVRNGPDGDYIYYHLLAAQ